MCIAILNTPNVTFPKDLISNCWDNNGDGAGLIYTNAGTLYTFKELHSVDKFYTHYADVRKRFPKSKIVLHFRISTSGGVNVDNCHPFNVHKDLAFVHNGIISDLNGIDPKKSDTNLFNERILQKLPVSFEHNEAIIKLVEEYIGSSKLIFLNAKNEAVIVNEDLGQEDSKYPNCWFSNSTYKPSAYYDRGGVKVWKGTDSEDEDYGYTYNYSTGNYYGDLVNEDWEEQNEFYDAYQYTDIDDIKYRFAQLDSVPAFRRTASEKNEYFALSDLINEHRWSQLSDKAINDLTDAEYKELHDLEQVLGYAG
jgi:hypothetical protein